MESCVVGAPEGAAVADGCRTPACAPEGAETSSGIPEQRNSTRVAVGGSRRKFLASLLALLPRSDLPGARQKTPWGVNRWIILLLYTFYNIATSAVFYGWTALSELIFKNEGFAHLCFKDPVTGAYDPDFRLEGKLYICDNQDAAVQKLYTVTFAVACTMSAFAGTLLDGLGPLLTALLGQILNITGWLLFSFSSSHFFAYPAAFVFIGLGSDTSFLPTFSIRRLFPGSTGLILTILGSAASVSFGIPLILVAAVKGCHTSVRTVCLAYCALGPALCMIIALLFIPFRGFSIDDEGEVWDDATPADGSPRGEISTSRVLEDPARSTSQQVDEEQPKEGPSVTGGPSAKGRGFLLDGLLQQITQLRDSFFSPSFWRQLLSVRFGLIVGYFVVVSWSSAYYQQAARRMFSAPVVHVMEILLPLSFVPCIILGKLADIFGIVEIILFMNSSGVLMYALSFFTSVAPAGYISVIFFTIYMSLFTSQVYVYVEETFSPQHFGKLIGIATMVGGLLSLITNPLYEHVTLEKDQGSPLSMQIAVTVLLCLQYAPITALLLLRRKNPKPYNVKEGPTRPRTPPVSSGGNDAADPPGEPAHFLKGGTDVSAVQKARCPHEGGPNSATVTAPAHSGSSASTDTPLSLTSFCAEEIGDRIV